MSAAFRIDVDPGKAFARQLSELERSQVPYATMQTVNAVAADIHQRWREIAPRVFDRPTRATTTAAIYRKARKKTEPVAEIRIRDEASGRGAPPSRWLEAQVEGGGRRQKPMELLLQSLGLMPKGTYMVPGSAAPLDQHGNIQRGQLNRIKAQIRAFRDPLSHETAASRKRSERRLAKQGKRGGRYFVATAQRGKVRPGIYERLRSGFGSTIRPVALYVPRVRYRKRYDIYDIAKKRFERQFPKIFAEQLQRAVASTIARGGGR